MARWFSLCGGRQLRPPSYTTSLDVNLNNTAPDYLRCAVCAEPQGEVRDALGDVVAYELFTLTVAGQTCSTCTEGLRSIDQRFVQLRASS